VKTFAQRPEFELDDNEIVVPERRKIIAYFTQVLDLERPHLVRLIDLDDDQREVIIK